MCALQAHHRKQTEHDEEMEHAWCTLLHCDLEQRSCSMVSLTSKTCVRDREITEMDTPVSRHQGRVLPGIGQLHSTLNFVGWGEGREGSIYDPLHVCAANVGPCVVFSTFAQVQGGAR